MQLGSDWGNHLRRKDTWSREGNPKGWRVGHLPRPEGNVLLGYSQRDLVQIQPLLSTSLTPSFSEKNRLLVSSAASLNPRLCTNVYLHNKGIFVSHFCGSFLDVFHFSVVFQSASSRAGGGGQDGAHTATTPPWPCPHHPWHPWSLSLLGAPLLTPQAPWSCRSPPRGARCPVGLGRTSRQPPHCSRPAASATASLISLQSKIRFVWQDLFP